ncbi:hypothetical protein BC834DRAFT_548301 [Gloeopeniophorella convolvens]|nr:hypothetical protein BC834DRAFT_548301 [Gloeopeniophorella convolvens]
MQPRTLLLVLAALAAPLTAPARAAHLAPRQAPAANNGAPAVPAQCAPRCGVLSVPQSCTQVSMNALDSCVQCIADVAPSSQASFAAAQSGQATLNDFALSCERIGVPLLMPSVTAHAVPGATAAPARVSYVPDAPLPTALPAGGRGLATVPASGVQAATPGGSTAAGPVPTRSGSKPAPLGAEGDGAGLRVGRVGHAGAVVVAFVVGALVFA